MNKADEIKVTRAGNNPDIGLWTLDFGLSVLCLLLSIDPPCRDRYIELNRKEHYEHEH